MASQTRSLARSSFNIRFPSQPKNAEQDAEWFAFDLAGQAEQLRIHDYPRIYEIPGLYEALVYEKLACRSPYRLSSLLARVVKKDEQRPEDLSVLDLGAGNGVVAEELREVGVTKFVGLDLISEARIAAERDRPRLYSNYLVADVRNMTPHDTSALERANINCLVSVAALGSEDIAPAAFAAALDYISTPGWVGLTINEEFPGQTNSAGLDSLIRTLERIGVLEIRARDRYCHRLSIAGDPIFCVALVARKIADVPESLIAKECQ